MERIIRPGSTIGIIGGGQLGQMMALSAKAMGFKTAVLDPTPNSPTAQVADEQIIAPYSSLEAAKQLRDVADVITYEFENVDVKVLEYLEQEAYLPQGSQLIQTTQDRAFEKEAIEQSNAKVAPYKLVDNNSDLLEAVNEIGLPSILKTRRFGYDGKGQVVIETNDNLNEASQLLEQGPCILEEKINFNQELSVMVVRSTAGEVMTYPVSENIHVNHILHQSIVPARVSEQVESQAKEVAIAVAETLGVIGALGVELFLGEDDTIYVNEVAPRPHNSGHYTLDACITSQFEQHVRAICGWALGNGKLMSPVVMTNVLGQHLEEVNQQVIRLPQAKLHLYGKAEAKQNRKMGHINFVGNDVNDMLKQIKQLNIWREQHDRALYT
ncbi:5-(carboxyamino)imidazole ribonucleotide synthase [Alkalibacillus haloalkaliphilus]|uniref:5-(carboxyamino)imidazole ribonucleotide synthase n=1 Tax=Alkalibacillus haloalkaliphilus TaxID=94136 RepID=UPI002935C718|nr:5-(carboxyamino)imidazole ribonucleotide synthase [Alkalibacillus haloalkaliphilus]MDV2582636.1 5-(carboxyamino)imidazole ribonucleotide synthase [Alkalibacillus haloalkaliphilus]